MNKKIEVDGISLNADQDNKIILMNFDCRFVGEKWSHVRLSMINGKPEITVNSRRWNRKPRPGVRDELLKFFADYDHQKLFMVDLWNVSLFLSNFWEEPGDTPIMKNTTNDRCVWCNGKTEPLLTTQRFCPKCEKDEEPTEKLDLTDFEIELDKLKFGQSLKSFWADHKDLPGEVEDRDGPDSFEQSYRRKK